MTAMDPKPYPLDFDELERGDIISGEELQKIYPGVDERDMNFKRMALAEQISQRFAERGFGKVTVRGHKDGLKILTAQEQHEHFTPAWASAKRRLRKLYEHDLHNDVAALTDEQKQERENRLVRVSWQLQQLRKRPKLELPSVTEGDD